MRFGQHTFGRIDSPHIETNTPHYIILRPVGQRQQKLQLVHYKTPRVLINLFNICGSRIVGTDVPDDERFDPAEEIIGIAVLHLRKRSFFEPDLFVADGVAEVPVVLHAVGPCGNEGDAAGRDLWVGICAAFGEDLGGIDVGFNVKGDGDAVARHFRWSVVWDEVSTLTV